MTTTTPVAPGVPSAAPVVLDKASVKNWKPPIAFAIFSVLGFILLIVAARTGLTTYQLSTRSDLIQLPNLVLDVTVVSYVVVVS
ncbi:MAG: ABC transporter permease, partial [Salinibacterium sp.]